MIFTAHTEYWYMELEARVKMRVSEVRGEEPIDMIQEVYKEVESLSCQERMEFSYWRQEQYSRREYPLNTLVVSPEWYKKCFEEFGGAFLQWNGLSVFLDRDMPFSYAFTQTQT